MTSPATSYDQRLNAVGGFVLLLLAGYGFWFVAIVPHTVFDPPWIFLDYANLIFHEAGHFIFAFFGDFLRVLGGSLMQLIVPGVALGSFVFQKQSLSSGFALFWLGESLCNLSFCISDARTQALPLLGGDTSGHDWTWLLTRLNILDSDTLLGGFVHSLAFLIMLTGLVWMARSIYGMWMGKEDIA